MYDFPGSKRLSRPPLHRDLCGQPAEVGHALRVRGVVERPGRLPDELHARLVGAHQRVGGHLNGKELLAEEGELHEVEQLLEVGLSLRKVLLRPVDEGGEHRLLALRQVQVVAAQKVLLSGVGDEHKALVLRHLSEIPPAVGEGGFEELLAGLELGKVGHVETHGAVEAVLEKLAARLPCPQHLEEVGGGQETLRVLLVDLEGAGVGELDEEGEGIGVDSLYDHPPLATLSHLPTEHGPEVHAAGGQDHAVRAEALLVHHELHVAQFLVATELLHALQGLLRERLVDKVGHLQVGERRRRVLLLLLLLLLLRALVKLGRGRGVRVRGGIHGGGAAPSSLTVQGVSER